MPGFDLHWSGLRDQPIQLTLSREKVQEPFPKPPKDSLDVKKQWVHLAALVNLAGAIMLPQQYSMHRTARAGVDDLYRTTLCTW